MTSVFQRALGRDFARLHPRLRERFGFGAADGRACVGTGTMHRIWPRPGLLRPFFALGATRHVLFPDRGVDVPFTIENRAAVDRHGRDTLTFIRTFAFPHRERRFDAIMVYSEERGCVEDYLGTRQHIAVDLDVSAGERGELRITSGEQRVHGVRCPAALTGHARLRESFDEELDRFLIDVRITNPWYGLLMAYAGTFSVTYVDSPAAST